MTLNRTTIPTIDANMDFEHEQEAESGYEASNEATIGDSSTFSEPSSTNSRVSANASSDVRRYSSNLFQHQSEATVIPAVTGTCRLSSSSPSDINQWRDERLHFRSQRRPTTRSADVHSSISSSSLTAEMASQPGTPRSTQMKAGTTAREVAERAQDDMLIRTGQQKTPAQLIKKSERSSVTENHQVLQFGKLTRVCDDCWRRKVRSPSLSPFGTVPHF